MIRKIVNFTMLIVITLTMSLTSAYAQFTQVKPTGVIKAPVTSPARQGIDPNRVITSTLNNMAANVCTEPVIFTGGNVFADRILTKACSPYTITSDINVYGNATLTIERGVTVRFNPDKRLSIGQNGPARLVAAGTASEPIVLTSSNSMPGAGDWAGIQLWGNTMSGTGLSYLRLDYCGSNGDACLLGNGVKPNRVTVDHVIFAHVGAGSNAIWQRDADSNFFISSCTFSDIPTYPTQQYAIALFAPSFAGIDTTNQFNGAMVELMGGIVSYNMVWKNIGAVVAVTSDIKIEGPVSPTLTIAAGSIFKFAVNTEISVGYNNPGRLGLYGTAASRVMLMSLASNPGPGDWRGIVLWYNSSAVINYSGISHAGSDNGAVSVMSNSDVLNMQNSDISYSASYGIGVPCGSTANITNTGNTFTGNARGNIGPGPASSGPDCPK
jgi:hypothetical protein